MNIADWARNGGILSKKNIMIRATGILLKLFLKHEKNFLFRH